MILIDAENQQRRWQGSAAAEEIGQLLPRSDVLSRLTEHYQD
jgi:predicted DCC family thiol-disulfide oxidoreductase YuxK